jgi:hypothetical protein
MKYLISFNSLYNQSQKYASLFFSFFFWLRKLGFTDTIAIFYGIQRFSRSNKTFSHTINADSKSAQKTESNVVSFKLIWQLSFFLIFPGIVPGLILLYTGQKMKVVKLTWKILHLTQFFNSKIVEYRLKWLWYQ